MLVVIVTQIPWFEGIGLSHDKINAIIMRHPNILGISIDKYEALIKWYLSHGVAQDKVGLNGRERSEHAMGW